MTEVELLNRIYSAMSRGGDLAAIVSLAAEGAKSLFSGHAATVYSLDESKEHLIPQNWGLPEGITSKIEKLTGFRVRGLRFPVLEGGHYWRTIHERRAFLLSTPEEIEGMIGELASDHRALQKLVPAIARLLGYRSVLTAPIVSSEDVVGVVDLGSKAELDGEDLARFERLAGTLSVAFTNARLLKLTDHLNLVLRALRDVNQLITKEHNRERLLQRAVNILTETRGYRSAWIVLCNEKQDPRSMFSAGLGKESNFLKELLGKGKLPVCAERALSQAGVVTILDQPSECIDCPLLGKLPEHREMTVRLEHEDMVYGFISAALPLEYVEEKEEEELFLELAGDIASALYRLGLEEKNAQSLETLRESEERFRSIVETSHAGILMIDQDYRILYVNEALTRIFGWASEDVIGHDFREFLDDESRQLVAERYVLRQRGEDVPSRYEFNVICKDGTKRRVEISSTTTRDLDGGIRTIAQLLDITDRVRAQEELREENRMVLALSRSAATIVSSLDTSEVLDHILEELENVIDADGGSVMLIDGEVARIVRARRFQGPVQEYDVVGEKFRVPDTPNIRQVIETGAPVVIADTSADPNWLRLPGQEWIASWAGIPIAVRGSVIGILNADSTTIGKFDQNEIERMQTFASIAAAAIENARLLAETKRRAEERAVLTELGRALASTLDLHSIYRTAHQYVSRLVDCANFTISLFDSKSQTLSAGFVLSDGEEIDVSQLPPLKHRSGAKTGRGGALNLRRALIVDDIAEITKKNSDAIHVESDMQPESAIYVPMIAEGDIIGLLEVQSYKRHAYSEADIPPLSMAANQIALFIRNASLYAEMADLKTFNERIVTSLNEGVVLEDASGVISFVNRAASELLGYSPAELVGMHWFELAPEEIRAEIIGRMESRRAGESERYETILLTKAGETIPVIVSVRPLFHKGAFSGVISVITDIRERKEAEKRTQRAFEGAIEALQVTTESRDAYTAGHQRRVSDLAVEIARRMGIPEDTVEGIRIAGMVHDIGKLSVPTEILTKPTRLSDIEMEIIRTHSRVAYDILKGIDFPWPIADIVLQHHERMDGSGYPQGLKGDEIMLEARILAVADVVEAMSSHRPYRPALGTDAALDEIKKNRGQLYDPDVVDACIAVFENGFVFD